MDTKPIVQCKSKSLYFDELLNTQINMAAALVFCIFYFLKAKQ